MQGLIAKIAEKRAMEAYAAAEACHIQPTTAQIAVEHPDTKLARVDTTNEEQRDIDIATQLSLKEMQPHAGTDLAYKTLDERSATAANAGTDSKLSSAEAQLPSTTVLEAGKVPIKDSPKISELLSNCKIKKGTARGDKNNCGFYSITFGRKSVREQRLRETKKNPFIVYDKYTNASVAELREATGITSGTMLDCQLLQNACNVCNQPIVGFRRGANDSITQLYICFPVDHADLETNTGVLIGGYIPSLNDKLINSLPKDQKSSDAILAQLVNVNDGLSKDSSILEVLTELLLNKDTIVLIHNGGAHFEPGEHIS